MFGLAVASIMGSSMLDAQGITSIAVSASGSKDLDLDQDEVYSSALSHDAACARAFK